MKTPWFAAAASAVLTLSASACAASTQGDEGPSEAAAERLAQFERTGETRNCLQLSRIDSIKPLDEKYFLVETRGDGYYLNVVNGRCSQADSAFTFLQYDTSTSSLCANEIIRVRDQNDGGVIGSCSLSRYEKLEPAE